MSSHSGVLAIINPISGISSKQRVPGLLAEAFSKSPHELFITYSRGQGHAAALAREAIDKRFDTVVAVGGDGTINEVAGELYKSDLKLGIIPQGSGNGLARALNIPIDNVEKAIRVITQGHVRAIDTGLAAEKPFFCTFGVGFDAALTKKYDEAEGRGLLTYVFAAIDSFLSYKPKKFRMTVDGKEIGGKAFLITCANIDQYGNNAYIAPGASPSDGLLDVVIIRPFNQLLAGHVALQLLTKSIGRNAATEAFRGQHIIIEREEEGHAQLDGESLTLGRTIEIKIVPRSLHVYTPRS